MIRLDNLAPEVAEAYCTPMHLIIRGADHDTDGQVPSDSSMLNDIQKGSLWLGSFAATVDKDLLQRHGVEHLVQMLDVPWLPDAPPPSNDNGEEKKTYSHEQDSNRPTSSLERAARESEKREGKGNPSTMWTGKDGIERYRVDLLDTPTSGPELPRQLERACDDIDNARGRGKNVLVHCQQGVSRSPALVIGYLIRSKEHAMSYSQAFDYVIERRACIKPNSGFQTSLKEYSDIWDLKRDPPTYPKRTPSTAAKVADIASKKAESKSQQGSSADEKQKKAEQIGKNLKLPPGGSRKSGASGMKRFNMHGSGAPSRSNEVRSNAASHQPASSGADLPSDTHSGSKETEQQSSAVEKANPTPNDAPGRMSSRKPGEQPFVLGQEAKLTSEVMEQRDAAAQEAMGEMIAAHEDIGSTGPSPPQSQANSSSGH